MHTALANGVEDGVEPVVLAAREDARVVLGPLAQGLADGAIQVVVRPALDAWNDVYGFKGVQDSVLGVDNGHAANVAVDHEVNHLKNGGSHACNANVGVRAHLNVSKRLLEQNGIVFVVDSDEFEDSVLGNDGDDRLSAGLVIHIDEGDSARARLKHASKSFVERPGGMDGGGFDGRRSDCLFNVCVTVSLG